MKKVAIIDYGMGNLYSVRRACEVAGLDASLTNSPADVDAADAIILPGVGAFGYAMTTLRELGLDRALVRAARSGRPFLGVCLGMQLLMNTSQEFGAHEGLGLVEGTVERLPDGMRHEGIAAKVPEVGWNAIGETRPGAWRGTLLDDVRPGSAFYFVHSYVVKPTHAEASIAVTRYGDVEYCSALRSGNVIGCQFHPERSGPLGLSLYRQFLA